MSTAAQEHTYSVRTWDSDEQAYTPQTGLSFPSFGLTLWQLRAALRELRGLGYTCHRIRSPAGDHDWNDAYVLVERDDEQTDGRR